MKKVIAAATVLSVFRGASDNAQIALASAGATAGAAHNVTTYKDRTGSNISIDGFIDENQNILSELVDFTGEKARDLLITKGLIDMLCVAHKSLSKKDKEQLENVLKQLENSDSLSQDEILKYQSKAEGLLLSNNESGSLYADKIVWPKDFVKFLLNITYTEK